MQRERIHLRTMARLKNRRAAKGLGERNRELCDYPWLMLSAQRSFAHIQGPGSNTVQEEEQEMGKTCREGQTCMWDFH